MEGFKILCTDFDHILEKKGKLFKWGYCSREGTNQRNTVYIFDLKVTKINVVVIVGNHHDLKLAKNIYLNIFLKFNPSRFEGKTVNLVAKVARNKIMKVRRIIAYCLALQNQKLMWFLESMATQ